MGILDKMFGGMKRGSMNIIGSTTERGSVKMKSAGKITVNGQDFVGRNLTINGNTVIIDGVEVDGLETQKEINISVTGDCEFVKSSSGDVTVTGSTGSVNTMSGDVTVRDGSINGNVETMSGDVATKGSITGSVKTMSGDIRHK